MVAEETDSLGAVDAVVLETLVAIGREDTNVRGKVKK